MTEYKLNEWIPREAFISPGFMFDHDTKAFAESAAKLSRVSSSEIKWEQIGV